jgi:amidophosphoribosyltransferase
MNDVAELTTDPFDDDKLHEECGIFAVHGHKDAAALTALGLHALQHRGQEACGIVTHDGRQFHSHRALGQVGDNFSAQRVIDALPGRVAIGHNRYATTGETILRNVQPLFAEYEFGGFALGHNGNLTNAAYLRRVLIRQGCLFQSTTDTEVIHHLMARAHGDVETRLLSALNQVEGAYSLVAIAADRIIGVRDPLGVRPLVLGQLDGAWILASETCALDIIGARFEREIEPGELVTIGSDGLRTARPFGRPAPQRFCVFEYIYFARPDSVVEGVSIYEARKRIGGELARESGVPADVVVPVPDSGVPAALGYAAAASLPFELGIIRNHYVGRTFIEPTDQIRHLGVKLKHNANRAKLEGRRVILVDDSIVRGTTSKKIVEMVRQAGAAEVHMRISSPPTAHPCFYGIDTPQREKLLASRFDLAGMAAFIGVDSLAFISIDGLYRAMGQPGRDSARPTYCDACFTGAYPTRLADQDSQDTAMPLLRTASPTA